MKGLWKSNLSKWNHKHEKRKKQSLKHILKDNAKALLNSGNSKNFTVENEQEVLINKYKRIYFKAEIYDIEVMFNSLDSSNSSNSLVQSVSLKAYRDENVKISYEGREYDQWFELNTNKRIDIFLELEYFTRDTLRIYSITKTNKFLDLKVDLSNESIVTIKEFKTTNKEIIYGSLFNPYYKGRF